MRPDYERGAAPAKACWTISGESQFQISVGPPPQKRDSCRPILAVDSLSGRLMLCRRKNTRRRCELRSCYLAPNRASCHPYLRITTDALVLARKRAGHHIEFVPVFSEPHRGWDSGSVLAKGG